MLYGYVRVSTAGQASDGNSIEAQTDELVRAGVDPAMIYTDVYTGKTTQRPQLNELMRVIASGDTLVVTKLDRIARSVIDGCSLVKELTERGVSVNILTMGMIDSSPQGMLIFHIFLSFAEFERGLIAQRTQEGKAVAKQKADYREGRPRVYTKKRLNEAMKLLEENSYKEVSEMTGISKSTLIRERRRRKVSD